MKTGKKIIIAIVATLCVLTAIMAVVIIRVDKCTEAVNSLSYMFTTESESGYRNFLKKGYTDWEIDYVLNNRVYIDFDKNCLNFACERIDYMFEEQMNFDEAVNYICIFGFTEEQARKALNTMQYSERQAIYAPIN